MRSVIRLRSLAARCEAGCVGPVQQHGNRRFDVWPYSNFAARCDVNAVNPCCEQSPAGTRNQCRAIKTTRTGPIVPSGKMAYERNLADVRVKRLRWAKWGGTARGKTKEHKCANFLSKYRDLGKMGFLKKKGVKWLNICFYTALDVAVQSVSCGHFSKQKLVCDIFLGGFLGHFSKSCF